MHTSNCYKHHPTVGYTRVYCAFDGLSAIQKHEKVRSKMRMASLGSSIYRIVSRRCSCTNSIVIPESILFWLFA